MGRTGVDGFGGVGRGERSTTYRAVHPGTAIEVPRRLRPHRVAKHGAHVLVLPQITEHTAHRGARQAFLIRSVGQERRPRRHAADADPQQARPGTLRTTHGSVRWYYVTKVFFYFWHGHNSRGMEGGRGAAADCSIGAGERSRRTSRVGGAPLEAGAGAGSPMCARAWSPRCGV